MLIDLELLAHTDYLVASDHSRWSQVLQYMRYILYGVLLDPEPQPLPLTQAAMIPSSPVAELMMPARCQACISLVAATFLFTPERPLLGMLLIPTRRRRQTDIRHVHT